MRQYDIRIHVDNLNVAKMREMFRYLTDLDESAVIIDSPRGYFDVYFDDKQTANLEYDMYLIATQLWKINDDYCDITYSAAEISPMPEIGSFDAGDWQMWKERGE